HQLRHGADAARHRVRQARRARPGRRAGPCAAGVTAMRWLAALGLIIAGAAGAEPVRAPVHVTYDADHLDLDRHVLQFQMSRPAESAKLVAMGEDGQPLGTGSASYDHPAPGTWLSVSWTQPAEARVLKLQLRAVSADGLATRVELIPWSVTIDHEDVNFATNSAAIERAEEAKLDASLTRIGEVGRRSEKFVKMQRYVAG